MATALKPLYRPITTWKGCIKRIFGHVGVTIIAQSSRERGAWKLGKTNLGLYLSQKLLEWNIVKEVATNIDTFGQYPQVADLYSLNHWLRRNRYTKAYILDEINIHASRRRSMSNMNVGILQIFPEISKARARLIVIAQDIEGMDKDIKKQIWVRGYFIKKSIKKVQILSNLLSKPYSFNGLPATNIKYDPYDPAPFTLRPPPEMMFKDKDLQKLYSWANGKTWKELFDHPNQCNRFVRRNVRKLLEKSFTDSLNK